MNCVVIGLVGTPASGKSTVAARLESGGGDWINADKIAKQVLESESAKPRLLDRFGPQVLAGDRVDRQWLAAKVFGRSAESAAALEALESIIHPITRQRIRRRLMQSEGRFAILDVPLLFESQWDLACDTIWCVDAPRDRRNAWARERGWGEDELARREARQMAIGEKRRLSDIKIVNDSTLQELHRQVDARLADYLGDDAPDPENWPNGANADDWACGWGDSPQPRSKEGRRADRETP